MPPPGPIPIPPRTPSPLPDDDEHTNAGPIGGNVQNMDALSPLTGTFPPRGFGSFSSLSAQSSQRSPLTPASTTISTLTADSDGASATSETTRNPFNFQTVTYTAGKPLVGKPDIGKRRGHKYKHSSISYNIFQEPAPRTPLQLPASLPIPTWNEFKHSMSKEQRHRSAWCFCHLGIAAYVQWSATGSLAMTALSHLLFWDAISAFLCVAVDVGNNFEVWKRSSIRYPFGLERSEVLAGLAMSVGLLFMGLDLISHGLKDLLEDTGGHESHHPHEHTHLRISPGTVDTAALAAIIATIVSAQLLRNHARLGKVMRIQLFEGLPNFLRNPSHLLTISCSTSLLLLPLLSLNMYTWIDITMASVMSVFMILLGGKQCYALGRMLLMSYAPGPSSSSVAAVLEDIQAEPGVSKVQDAKFWQVHYGLCMANLKLRVRGADTASKIREKVERIVKNRLNGAYGTGGGVKWEVNTQLMIEKD